MKQLEFNSGFVEKPNSCIYEPPKRKLSPHEREREILIKSFRGYLPVIASWPDWKQEALIGYVTPKKS